MSSTFSPIALSFLSITINHEDMVRSEVEKREGDRSRSTSLLVGLVLYLKDRDVKPFVVQQ